MADEPEKSGQEPNLELPSLLSFGRNRRKRKGEAPEGDAGTEETTSVGPETEASPPDSDPLAADPVAPPSPGSRGALAPSADRAKRLPPVPPPTARGDEAKVQIPVPPPPLPPPGEPEEVEEPPVIVTPRTVEEPAPVVEPLPVEEETAPVEEPVVVEEPAPVEETLPVVEEPVPVDEPVAVEEPLPVQEPARVDEPVVVEQTTILPAQEPAARGPEFVPAQVEVQRPTTAEVPVEAPLGRPVEQAAEVPTEQRPARDRTSLTLPAVDPRLAVVITGLLVGLVGVVLAYFASRGCETVRGVGSCGGVGLLALLMIVAVEVVLGAIILKAWQIADPTSTSFLGVGLVAVFVLLFLLSSLESVWMILVIPVLSALTFLLSWWVTTAFVEVPGEDAHR